MGAALDFVVFGISRKTGGVPLAVGAVVSGIGLYDGVVKVGYCTWIGLAFPMLGEKSYIS